MSNDDWGTGGDDEWGDTTGGKTEEASNHVSSEKNRNSKHSDQKIKDEWGVEDNDDWGNTSGLNTKASSNHRSSDRNRYSRHSDQESKNDWGAGGSDEWGNGRENLKAPDNYNSSNRKQHFNSRSKDDWGTGGNDDWGNTSRGNKSRALINHNSSDRQSRNADPQSKDDWGTGGNDDWNTGSNNDWGNSGGEQSRPSNNYRSPDKKRHSKGWDCNSNDNDKNSDSEQSKPYKPQELDLEEEAKLQSDGAGKNFHRYKEQKVTCIPLGVIQPISKFDDIIYSKLLLKNVTSLNYSEMTPIQKWAMPAIKKGYDIIGCAQTGSGKTAAFLLPILQDISNTISSNNESIDDRCQHPYCLIISPTRELAKQLYTHAEMLSKDSLVKCRVIYGQIMTGHLLSQIQRGCHVLVATPGRLKDFVGKGWIGFKNIRYVVLDEGDRLVDDSFTNDIQGFFNHETMPPKDNRQTLFFSATFKQEIQQKAQCFLKDDFIFLAVGRVGAANEDIKQEFLQVDRHQKKTKLKSILSEIPVTDKTIVFTQTKKTADFLASFFSGLKLSSTSIHGDRHQSQREEAISAFRRGEKRFLISSPVGNRGLDLPKVAIVINYDMPDSIDEYVHRIGRTGRAGHTGRAISFFDIDRDREILPELMKILEEAKQEIPAWMADNGSGNFGDSAGGFGELEAGLDNWTTEGDEETSSNKRSNEDRDGLDEPNKKRATATDAFDECGCDTRLRWNINNKLTSSYQTTTNGRALTSPTIQVVAAQQRFVDSSALKPSLILILPQSFKVPTNPSQAETIGDQIKLQQYVAIINNAHDSREDELLRQQFKKLALQVRDARQPLTGQLFYEVIFDYFLEGAQNHLLIPINLEQVSTYKDTSNVESSRSLSSSAHSKAKYADAVLSGSGANSILSSDQTQQLIVSIRPHQLDSGYASDSIEFVSSAPVPIELVSSFDGRRSFSIIQTDKPVYKPDEVVRIRALVVNENLRPVVGDEVRIQIKNPHKLVVEEIRFPRPPNEMANKTQTKRVTNDQQGEIYLDHLFDFPPEPMLGIWSVHLLHNDPIANDTTSFEVREYTLPPFELSFESPQNIVPSTQFIVGGVTARYHYGKPVHGKVTLKFGYKESLASKTKFIARSIIKTTDPDTGRVDYKISTEKFKDNLWFPQIAGSRFVVEATVTEVSSGHRETAQDASCSFIKMPYVISFDNSIEDFKPGLTQQLSVQLVEALTLKPGPAGLKILVEYRDQNGTSLSEDSTISSSKQQRNILQSEAITDTSGRAVFNIGPVRDDISNIVVNMKVLNSTSANSNNLKHDEVAIGHHTLIKHNSQNGWISLMNKSVTHLSIGERFVSDLLIRDAVVNPQRIFYLITARGHIVALNRLDSNGLVNFQITEHMMPSIRLVLFALTHDSVGLLSDSMRIDIDQDLSCGMNLRYDSSSVTSGDDNKQSTSMNSVRPNDRGKLHVSARQGDLVSLIAVDSAVYSLYNRSRLESMRIIERVKRLDLGCGFGGGRDNLDVFHNAGLMFFKDNSASVTLPNGTPSIAHIGSSCLTITNQLKYVEDTALGYSKPMLSQLGRALEISQRHRWNQAHNAQRSKREINAESILKRYKKPMQQACCWLGTLEDIPQKRLCSVRRQIVERYMRHQAESCASIYFDCCRAVFGEPTLGLSSLVPVPIHLQGRMAESPVIARNQAPQYTEAIFAPNHAQLERLEAQTLVRRDFRETWLFELVDVRDASGQTTIDVQLPHSITSWSISALALNFYHPICLMPTPYKIHTFQEVFIQLSMPYKVVQGEQIDLVATLFNYSPKSQDVLVYMYGIEDVCSDAEPGERTERRRVRLDKHSSQAVLFPIIPLRTGKFPVKILAITKSSNTSDIVERHLNVVPRGKTVMDETTFSLDPRNQQRRNKRAIQTGNLIDEIDSTRGLQHSRIRLTPTRESEYIVPQTRECIVSAIGDRMGQTVQTTLLDVENLIRLPHGCGEQVMIYLGPTLYTARYLNAVDKLTGDSRWRAIRYIQSGYKRILNFRKEDGAFSAFARRDPSIWLTAFVAKMLCQTERTPFIGDEVHVDKMVINSALNWLIDSQNKRTGTWIELNPVYHREMLGGVLKENALTAFVTLTLNECAHHSVDLVEERKLDEQSDSVESQTNGINKLRAATQKAEEALLLDRYRALKEKNPYVLALVAYSLSFSQPREAALILADLISLSERSQSRNQLYWRGEYPIETAAYALQALIELAPIISKPQASSASSTTPKPVWLPGADAVAISNWLSSRRSYTGAFESTQDTIVALEALSKFAQLQSSPNGPTLLPHTTGKSGPNLSCNVTINNRTQRSIEFGEQNAQILQSFKLDSLDLDPISGEMLDVITMGNGLGTMSVKLKYNVFHEEDELCRFNIDSTIEEWQPKIVIAAEQPDKNQETGDDKHNSSNQDNLKLVSNVSDTTQQPNDTSLDEDFFKTFDKSMLNELNLIDLNQNEHFDVSNIQQQQQQQQQQRQQQPAKRILRLRRRAVPSVEQQKHLNVSHVAESVRHHQVDDSWSSRLMSTIRSKLPAWIAPKPTMTPVAERFDYEVPSRRNATSRRSTQADGAPLVTPSGTIPADAHLNTLSNQWEISSVSNNKSSTSNSTYQLVDKSSRRLILLLRVCVHHMSSRRDSEMAVIEIGVLSGFKPNEADLKSIINDVGTPAMKYELSADRSLVIIYLEHIPFSGPYCFQFRLIRDSLVYNLQSGYIRVYEYYSPTHSCSNYYTPSRVSNLIETKCDSSGQVCQCATNSLCPATSKLIHLSETHQTNATSARNKLIDLVCAEKYDLVSLARLKSVRYVESAKTYKLLVKIKSDLKGNLTKLMDVQRQQKAQLVNSVRKPTQLAIDSQSTDLNNSPLDEQQDDTSFDYLTLNIDSSCVRGEPLLLHLAHPTQWKQGGELMILLASSKNIEKRYFKTSIKQVSTLTTAVGPRPKPNTFSKDARWPNQENNNTPLQFDDAQQTQYSLALTLDKDSILHDLTYQAKISNRESINNLILWLELKSRREKWTCPVA